MAAPEPISMIEPLLPAAGQRRLEDLAVRLASDSAALAAQLASPVRDAVGDLVRSMNCYYSNLIEGHNTRPRDQPNVHGISDLGPSGVLSVAPGRTPLG